MSGKNLFELDLSEWKPGWLTGIRLQPRNPEAYECAMGLFYDPKQGHTVETDPKHAQAAKRCWIEAAAKGETYFIREVCAYLDYFRGCKHEHLVDGAIPLDRVAVWLVNTFARRPQGWTPTITDLSNLWYQEFEHIEEPAAKTFSDRCAALGLPLKRQRGRPKLNRKLF